MATIPLAGFTTPFVPHSGFSFWDTDHVPEQFGDVTVPDVGGTELTGFGIVDISPPSEYHLSPLPVRLSTIKQTDTQLQVALDAPVLLDPATEAHLANENWLFGSPPQVVNHAANGTILQYIRRLLNRLSKKSISRLLPAPSLVLLTPTTGPHSGGTSVSVFGTGFQAGLSATFGGVAGTVSAVTGGSFTVATPVQPAGPNGLPTAVDVVVTNPDGQSSTLASSFIYT